MAALPLRWEVSFCLRFRHIIAAPTAGDVRRISDQLAENPTAAVKGSEILSCVCDDVWQVKPSPKRPRRRKTVVSD